MSPRKVAIITSENKRYHMNIAIFKDVQRREMLRQIRDIISGAPGSLTSQEQMLTASVRERQNYIRTTYSNDQRLTIIQIEDIEALQVIDDIAQVPGIDMLFFGPADFAHSLGIPTETGNPQVAAAREKGLFRLEGKDYVMQDGDVTNFRFNVSR